MRNAGHIVTRTMLLENWTIISIRNQCDRRRMIEAPVGEGVSTLNPLLQTGAEPDT
jgi:hypothetical protein